MLEMLGNYDRSRFAGDLLPGNGEIDFHGRHWGRQRTDSFRSPKNDKRTFSRWTKLWN